MLQLAEYTQQWDSLIRNISTSIRSLESPLATQVSRKNILQRQQRKLQVGGKPLTKEVKRIKKTILIRIT